MGLSLLAILTTTPHFVPRSNKSDSLKRLVEPLRFDLLVDGCLFVEVKAVEKVHPIHQAQLLSYMKLLDIPLGLIINFHAMKLADGVSRLILPGANAE